MAEVSFGEWLKRQRKARGWTQTQLALQISCSPSALKKLEAEQRRPSPLLIERLAETFAIPTTERSAFLRFARGDWQSAPGELPAEAPWRTHRAALPPQLPHPLTSFVGRRRELTDVLALLRRQRLITLTGPGGVGKTRLALEAATRLQRRFADGVWWVELAPLTDERLIPSAVALALGVRELPNQSLPDVLAHHLQSRHLLLVLDNCEHLVSGCARLAFDLLTRCAGLAILATSRESLALTGEATYTLLGLSLPRPEHQTLADVLLEYESVCLFVERARQKSGLTLSDHNAAAVLQICRRLDGLPLALELAAALTPVLAVDTIAERLSDRFQLLTHGSRAALPRHQTLRATLDWSYDLLSLPERALFRRLAIFAGGCTLPAAQAICAGAGLEANQILSLLTNLVHKSLVTVQDRAGVVRYDLLETVSHYAFEKLTDSAEVDTFTARHSTWHLGLADEAERSHGLSGSRLMLDALASEHDNFRAALGRGLARGDLSYVAALVYILAGFWDVRAHWSEGRAWIERALESAPFEPQSASLEETTLRAQMLSALGRLLIGQRNLAAAEQVLTESVRLFRSLPGAPPLSQRVQESMGLAFNYLGFAAYYAGRYGPATVAYEEALLVYQALANPVGVGFTLTMLARAALLQGQYTRAVELAEAGGAMGQDVQHVHLIAAAWDVTGRALFFQGDPQAAVPRLEESLRLSREIEHLLDVVDTLNFLAQVEMRLGRPLQAAAQLAESLALAQTLDYGMGRASGLSSQAELALAAGDPARAKLLLAEALASFQRLGMKWYLLRCLELWAASDAADHQPHRAARLFSAASTLRASLGAPLPPVYRATHDGAIASAAERLGPAAFALALDEGRALTLDQAIADALADASSNPIPKIDS